MFARERCLQDNVSQLFTWCKTSSFPGFVMFEFSSLLSLVQNESISSLQLDPQYSPFPNVTVNIFQLTEMAQLFDASIMVFV